MIADLGLLRALARVRRILRARDLCATSARPSGGSLALEEMVTTRSRQPGGHPPVSLAQAVHNLQAAFPRAATPPPPVSSREASVLVPLFEAGGEVHVVLTQRSSRLTTHAGEVCLPGGKREPGDADAEATALREAHEELGLPPASVQVVASLPPVLSKHLLSVTPVVGSVPAGLRFTPDKHEVAAVFTAPLSMFLEAGGGYSHRDVRWEGCPYRLHAWDYRYRESTFMIWGLTAGMLVVVAEAALGRAAAFELSPPGAQPYTALAYDHGRLVFRGAPGGAAGPAASAAVAGATVTDEEAEAAVGEAGG